MQFTETRWARAQITPLTPCCVSTILRVVGPNFPNSVPENHSCLHTCKWTGLNLTCRTYDSHMYASLVRQGTYIYTHNPAKAGPLCPCNTALFRVLYILYIACRDCMPRYGSAIQETAVLRLTLLPKQAFLQAAARQ